MAPSSPARRSKMDVGELAGIVRAQIEDALDYDSEELSKKRAKALEYYRGELRDAPTREGQSRVTSRDLSDSIGWILPGVMRVFAASDMIVRYEPQNPDDEPFAQQATDYVNYVFLRECQGYRILRDGFQDGLLHGNGIWKHWWDTSKCYELQRYSGLDDAAYTELVSDDSVEVLEHTEVTQIEAVPDPATGQPVEQSSTVHDLKIKRQVNPDGRLTVACVPPEEFLIDRGATSIEDARFLCHRSNRTRQDLIDDGYDRDTVMALGKDDDLESTDERVSRWNKTASDRNGAVTDPLMEEVEVFESYLRVDFDGDGYAEWRRVVQAGQGGEKSILANDEWSDENPFSDAVPMPEPHRWQGRSLLDEIEDIQRVKTVLLRRTLDNLYLSNTPQRVANKNQIDNPDELVNPTPGGIVWTNGDPNAVTREISIPFVAEQSYAMLEYQDSLAEKRTGVSRTSMALDPDALQDQTATGQMLAQSAAYAKVELYARNMAELGLKRLFRCLLKLIVEHQDKPRMIRLRDQWVKMDPRSWNANMDANVSVGLGSGSRDRDTALLMQIAGKQEMIMLQLGPVNPVCNVQQYANTLRKMVESAGMRTPDEFFSEVNPQALQQLASQPKPDPKMAEVQGKLQLQQQTAAAQLQQSQMQAQQQAQLDAQKAEAEHQRKVMEIQSEADLKHKQMVAGFALKQSQLQAEIALKQQQLEAELALKAAQTKAQEDRADRVADNAVQLGGEPG